MSQLRRTIALLSTVGTACLWMMDNIDRIRSGNDYLDWARHHLRGMHGEEAQACAVAGGQLDALPEEACKIHGPVTCHPNIYAPATEPTCRIVHGSKRDGAGREILYTTCDTTIAVDAEGSDHDNVRLRRQHGY